MIWHTNRKYKYYLLLLTGLFFLTAPLAAQKLPGNIRIPTGGGGGQGGGAVLDDTTKNIYGPKTTSFFFEEDILNNRDSARFHVDTSLTYFHRWDFVNRAWGELVTLGNLGTASRPLFFEPRVEAGRQLGLNAYHPYGWQAGEIRYYDTKSPYTDMYFVMGGLNRDMLKVGFTQNIHPRLNVGLRVQRFTSERQYGSYAARGAAASLARNWAFLFHGSYFSKDGKYAFLGHVRTMNHSAREQGGVIPADIVSWTIGRDDYEGPARLAAGAKSWERRNNLRVYQQYKLLNGFQLFQQFEYQGTIDRYTDNTTETGIENGVYPLPAAAGESPEINQTITHHLLDNKVGIKGKLSGYQYRAYFRSRAQSMTGRYYETDLTQGNYKMSRFEPLLGAWMQYHLRDSTWKLTAEGEHVLARDLVLKGRLDIPWARLDFQTALTSPDMMMMRYRNSYLEWDNTDDSLKLSKVLTFKGALPLKTGNTRFTPEFQWHQLINYLYYDEQASPAQHSGTFSLMRIGFDSEVVMKRWRIRAITWYTEGFDNAVLRIPRLFASGEVSFSFTYAKAMDVELGLAGRYTSRYYADAYMPVTQQFHLQNTLKTGGYPVVDAFANLRIKRVLLLLRYAHLNQGWLAPAEGYYITPGYLELKPAFSLGVNWPLFD